MFDIIIKGGRPGPEIKKICKEMVKACDICSRSGQLLQNKKISGTHVCQPFNKKVQTDFIYALIRTRKLCIMHITDTETGYFETNIVIQRFSKMDIRSFESIGILRHGASKRFSADSEFTRLPGLQFLNVYNNIVAKRPV